MLLGLILAAALLGLYAAALIAIYRVPFRAFAVLVSGMAVHNFLLMMLLRLSVPAFIIRVLQSWKEGILLLLGAMVVYRLVVARRSGRLPKWQPMDYAAAAFAALLVIYVIMPKSVLHNPAGYAQRLVEFRQLIYIPLLYLYGRVFWPRTDLDLTWDFRFLLGAAGIVGLFGIVELWFVPTTTWISWGVNLLSGWLHYSYNGPQHLPDYFFQTTSNGLFLRRMVSTYVSPLGVAYTGLLLVPVAVVLFPTRRSGLPAWFRGASLALLIVAILLSVTRLAIGLLVIEMVLLLIVLRRRWLLVGAPVVALLALVTLFEYVNFGPLLNRDLSPVSIRPHHMAVVPTSNSDSDPSISGHVRALKIDFQFSLHHPLGIGLGNTVVQFGANIGRGESAIFGVFDDAGILTGLIYLSLFGFAIVNGYRSVRMASADPLRIAIPLAACVGGLVLLPIAFTSDVNGDFSVTFLFWWAAGFATTACTWLPRPDPLSQSQTAMA